MDRRLWRSPCKPDRTRFALYVQSIPEQGDPDPEGQKYREVENCKDYAPDEISNDLPDRFPPFPDTAKYIHVCFPSNIRE